MDQNHDLAAYMASVPGYQYAADSHGYYDPHRLGGFSRLDTRNGSKNRPFVFDEDLRLRFPIDTSPNQNAYHSTTPSNYSEYASMQLSSDLMSLVCTEFETQPIPTRLQGSTWRSSFHWRCWFKDRLDLPCFSSPYTYTTHLQALGTEGPTGRVDSGWRYHPRRIFNRVLRRFMCLFPSRHRVRSRSALPSLPSEDSPMFYLFGCMSVVAKMNAFPGPYPVTS